MVPLGPRSRRQGGAGGARRKNCRGIAKLVVGLVVCAWIGRSLAAVPGGGLRSGSRGVAELVAGFAVGALIGRALAGVWCGGLRLGRCRQASNDAVRLTARRCRPASAAVSRGVTRGKLSSADGIMLAL